MIPKKFREHLAELGESSMYLVEGLDPCLEVWPEGAFEPWYQRVIGAKQSPEIMRYRLLLNCAVQVPVDGAGRLLVPAHLRKSLALADKIIFVGDVTSFQLWEPETLVSTLREARSQAASIRTELATLEGC